MGIDVGRHHAKTLGNKEIPLAILSRTLAQIMRNPNNIILYGKEGLRMIVLVSLIVLLGHLFPRFFAWCIPTSPFINPRRACAGGLLYLSCVCIMTFSATTFVSTLEFRYVRVYYRLLNSWIFHKPFRSEVMA